MDFFATSGWKLIIKRDIVERNHEEIEEEEEIRDKGSLDQVYRLYPGGQSKSRLSKPQAWTKRDIPKAHQSLAHQCINHLWT
ncbi:hypothetical protein PIB30_039646 [Stylosanthes scabra]|uniref:Uncharacterized protein n=1 Tax=Stylosanthes scabra TaxID=79078 RepID=A0ABU6TE07_9FABA|nr:hypothetical protein [Stylosanthes scabra]